MLALDGRIALDPARARTLAAQRYGSAALAQHLRGSGDDPEWQQLRHQHAHIAVTVTAVTDDLPPATNTTSAAAVTAHRTVITPDGHHEPWPGIVVYCALHHYGQGWKVVDLRITADDPGVPPPSSR